MNKISWLKSGLVVSWPVTMDGCLGLYNDILKCGQKLKTQPIKKANKVYFFCQLVSKVVAACEEFFISR